MLRPNCVCWVKGHEAVLTVTAPVAPEMVMLFPATREVTPELVTAPFAYVSPEEKVVVATPTHWPLLKAKIVPGVGVPKSVDVAIAVGTPVAESWLAKSEFPAIEAKETVETAPAAATEIPVPEATDEEAVQVATPLSQPSTWPALPPVTVSADAEEPKTEMGCESESTPEAVSDDVAAA